MNVADPGSPEALTAIDFEASMFDRRAHHAPVVRVDGKSKVYEPALRTWQETTGIVLHQTACWMGERLERYDHIGAHFVVTRSGNVLWMADCNRIVYHGNGFNNRCVGIEVDGLYAGVEGDPRTVWDDPTTATREVAQTVTVEAMESTRQLVRWIVAEVAANGGKLTKLLAHRQSSETRRNDPGSEIWKQVALPLYVDLGLDDGGPGFRIGSGRPIPEKWDAIGGKGIGY